MPKEWAGQVGGWEKLVNRTSMTWRACGSPQGRFHRQPMAGPDRGISGAGPAPGHRHPDGVVTVGFSQSATPNALPDAAGHMLPDAFFDRDARQVARELIGMVLRRRHEGVWLSARHRDAKPITGTTRAAMHRSATRTSGARCSWRRHDLYVLRAGRRFAEHQRGWAGQCGVDQVGESPWADAVSGEDALARMQALNPDAQGRSRPPQRLCAGQTLLCRSLA